MGLEWDSSGTRVGVGRSSGTVKWDGRVGRVELDGSSGTVEWDLQWDHSVLSVGGGRKKTNPVSLCKCFFSSLTLTSLFSGTKVNVD